MPESFDVIVIGLGAMGSAACYHLSKRRQKVLGLDRFAPPHTLGSSHGQTRIIREAYFEHPLYVPLVQRAYELWAQLETESGRRLFQQTGGLMMGPPEGAVVSGAIRSAEQHRLRHEVLSAAEVRRRFPALQPSEKMVAVWEPRAGILFPEDCVGTHLGLARRNGVTVLVEETAQRWELHRDKIRVFTARGKYDAAQLLLTAGGWTASLLPDLKVPLAVERQVLFWFDATEHKDDFGPDRCPIYICEHDPGRFFYGFPDLGEGVKVAIHHEGKMTAPETIDREVRDSDISAMRRLVKQFLPQANGPLRSATVCLYTNTPDHHFLIDTHPHQPQVLIASPCSGHGFKFSSAIGEVLADLLTQGKSHLDLSLFRLDRFATNR